MRRPFIIANWKMNKNIHESVDFVKAIKNQLPANEDVGIAAQALSLFDMKEAAGNSNLQIIAQNASWHEDGPYTGEISLSSLADAGTTYVILGHLERRRLFNESNLAIHQKVKAALHYGISPIVCTDEEMVQTEVNGEIHYVFQQLEGVLDGVSEQDLEKMVISFEPSWAVGSKQNPSPEMAEAGCRKIRQSLADVYGPDVADQIRILYGGSVNPQNIQEIVAQPDIDGTLIGRASLDVDSFLQMVHYQSIPAMQAIKAM